MSDGAMRRYGFLGNAIKGPRPEKWQLKLDVDNL